MTFKQFLIIAFIAGIMCGIAFGESKPTDPKGRALQIEMDAYVGGFLKELEFTYDTINWSVVVLPLLEEGNAAVVYHWHIPEKRPGASILALFTFHEANMLSMSATHRRAIAAHEVGHVTKECDDLVRPNSRMDNETYYLVTLIRESCADLVATELTSRAETLATLRYLKLKLASHNSVLDARIRILALVIERERKE